MTRSQIIIFISLIFITILGFQNCGDVKVKPIPAIEKSDASTTTVLDTTTTSETPEYTCENPDPSTYMTDTMAGPGTVKLVKAPSRKIVSIPLMLINQNYPSYNSGNVGAYQTTITPTDGTAGIEMSISRCPGEIVPLQNCNGPSLDWAENEFTYSNVLMTEDKIKNKLHYCWAPLDHGPWYLNVRYTYDDVTCPPSIRVNGMCGWHIIFKLLH
jgi:hypothetical protein